ncbi:hypothetical protein THRCLA_08457 [Thraustotheca clavata]|uniref:Roadblock/LAMTOR2 domain-containing protein n=1 Tax=Thraustotheca clavata TaxID=74557 RepID=A0A1V9Z634_9STRA|nr:hypothetical protein THRCLA_08457 [Thraustotheca clavata]
MPQSGPNAHHLRCSGSTLYKISPYRHLGQVEAKANPSAIPNNAVVEAFGADKCPKLIRLLNEDDEATLLHALRCLAGVLKMPNDVVNCSNNSQHVLEPLAHLVFHNNQEIRRSAAIALTGFSAHAVGRAELISQKTMRKILKAFHRDDTPLLESLFDTALNVSSIMTGTQELSKHGYPSAVVEKLKRSITDSIRCRALRLLKACVNDGIPGTVLQVVELGGVEVVSKSIYSKNKDVRIASLQVTGSILYLEQGRESAIEHGVVKKLCGVLMDRDTSVGVAAAAALMVLAVHDEAKRELYEAGIMSNFLKLLHVREVGIQLNILKLITVMAAHPLAREAMRTKQLEKSIQDMTEDPNELLALVMSEVEETLERIKNHKGVEGYVIADKNGAVLRRHPHMDIASAERYSSFMKELTTKARGVVRDLNPKNDLQYLRIRLKKFEILVAHEKEFLVIVIQKWSPNPT